MIVDKNNVNLKNNQANQRKPICSDTAIKRDFISRVERKAAKDRKWLSVNEESCHSYCPYTTTREITQEAADEEEVVLRMALDSATGMSGISKHILSTT